MKVHFLGGEPSLKMNGIGLPELLLAQILPPELPILRFGLYLHKIIQMIAALLIIPAVQASLRIIQPDLFFGEINFTALNADLTLPRMGFVKLIQRDEACTSHNVDQLEAFDIVLTTCTDASLLKSLIKRKVQLIIHIGSISFDFQASDIDLIQISLEQGIELLRYMLGEDHQSLFARIDDKMVETERPFDRVSKIERQMSQLSERKELSNSEKAKLQNLKKQLEEVKLSKLQELRSISAKKLDLKKLNQRILTKEREFLQKSEQQEIANLTSDSNTVKFEIGLLIEDKSSFTLASNLKQYQSNLTAKGVEFNFYYALTPCYTCESMHNFTKPVKHCYGGGRYCYFSEDEMYIQNGTVVLDEYLQQRCLFGEDVGLWFQYMEHFNENCTSNKISHCMQGWLHFQNKSMDSISTCVKSSFVGNDSRLSENRILENFRAFNFHLSKPTLFLNGKPQSQGSFKQIVENLCAQYKESFPQICGRYEMIDKFTKVNQLEVTFIIIFIGLIFALVVLLAIQLARKLKPSQTADQQIEIDIQVDNL